MTRTNGTVLNRASERVSAGAAAIALTFLTLLTVDARADEPKVLRSVAVSYSDVSFATAKGAAQVYGKLRVAARKVCGVDDGVKDIALVLAARDCYETALADAVRRIDRPTLTAVHSANSHKFG